MVVNDPEILAEITPLFQDYERALVDNDVETLDRYFLDTDQAIRYGAFENLYGIEEIRAFRAARPAINLARALDRTQITTYGRDVAIAATLFRRFAAPGKLGRQMQTWVRLPQGWRIVAAHVSIIDEPK